MYNIQYINNWYVIKLNTLKTISHYRHTILNDFNKANDEKVYQNGSIKCIICGYYKFNS